MANWNELLKRRSQYPIGSAKWRELDRASLIMQGTNQINLATKKLGTMPGWNTRSPFEREAYARTRVSKEFEDMARRQKQSWRRRDIKSVSDTLRSIFGD